MPNWCFNAMTVSGPPETLKEFDERFKMKHTSYIGGSCAKPHTDDELKDVIEWRYANEGYHYLRGIEEREGYSLSNFIPMTRDDFLNGWYRWSLDNWGTKWDLGNEDVHFEEGKITYYFDTAWSPPVPVFEKMAKMYPDLSFSITCEEESNDFYLEYELTGGDYTKKLEIDWEEVPKYKFEHGFEFYYMCKDCGEYYSDYEDEYRCPMCDSINIIESLGDGADA